MRKIPWTPWRGRSPLAVLLCMTLTACAGTGGTGTDAACLAFAPITFSASNDTPETIRQVREHNAAWDALCRP